MLRSQHLRKKASSSAAGRNAQRRRREKLRSGRLKGSEEKMNRNLKGVKDVQNLSNSLRAQRDTTRESRRAGGPGARQQEFESVGTLDANETTSSSIAIETLGRSTADARDILKEKKAWWERNKCLAENIRKGKNQVGSEETEQAEEDVNGELKSVWDRLGQVEKSKMPRGPEFTEEEIPLPNTRDLLHTRVVGDSKAPKIPLYDGMTDLYDHLDNFHYDMEGRGANEATKCRLFPTTLKGLVTSWFKRLAPKSISSFAELRKVFLERYMIISDRLYTANDLSTVRQRPDEKLRDYITRFNNEYARGEGCDEATAHNALIGGLQGGDFYFSLTRNPPRSNQLLPSRATESGKEGHGRVSLNGDTSYQPRDKRPNDYAYDHSAKRKKGEPGLARKDEIRPEKHNQYTNFTPLNKSKGEIFVVIADELPNQRRRGSLTEKGGMIASIANTTATMVITRTTATN
ncbi:uncharacterized protein Pyn_18894 [Prunus yedoensis var. nudiflora]|uniref:Retrotransposon gag domain-containing protein n=1 Tax=Prunus yedoensis var. nudiflora TaxID=2094558 RepID=A0A314YXE4_PRUYE|nr:uncharacterized protein Pyn_18894 [Prunus yedoensis var. nudiflora]